MALSARRRVLIHRGHLRMLFNPSSYFKQHPRMGTVGLALLMAAIFAADTFTRLEIAAAGFYVVVILAGLGFLPRRGVIALAAICILLTIISLFLTPKDHGLHDLGVINALISIAAIAITAYLALLRAAAEDAAFEMRTQLVRIARIRSLGGLTASIAHEINQPLAAIAASGSACQRWLEHDPPNLDRALRALQRMVSDVNRASDVVARIRSQARNAEPRRVPVQLTELIEEVVVLAQGELDRHEILLSEHIQDDLPEVLADRVQVGQVLVNLMLNAVEAMREMPAAGRRLVLHVNATADEMVQLTLSDTGPGLSQQAREKLFDTFWTTKPDGTGLGLTISRDIIESHGGRLWAEPSRPGGAVFCFTLPVVRQERMP